MPDPIKTLTNLRHTRALSTTYTIAELETAFNNLSIILEEKKAKEAAFLAAQQEKEEKLAVYQEMLAADGLDINDLLTLAASTSKTKKQTRPPRPAKYAYTDESGQAKTWTGQGRTPTFLVDKKLENYLI